MDKLLIITGATATGKTSLSIELAKKFNGEIVSADSRQVYKFMDIGTGKDKDEYAKNGIKVWGLDLVNPDYNFNVSDYLKFVVPTITDIQKRNKLPILVGGTALYIKALLHPFETINVPPNEELRNKLSSCSVNKLQTELNKLDKNKWEKMNQSDRKNPRRLIRAIEVATNNENPKLKMKISNYNCLIICLTASYEYLYKRIDKRVDDRIKQGAAQEVQKIINMGYPFDLPSMTASGYKEFKNPATYVARWKFNEHSYARRQVSFMKKLNGLEINIENQGWKKKVSEEVAQWYSDTNDSKKT